MIWPAVLVHLKGPGGGVPELDPFFWCGGELVEGAEHAAVGAAPLPPGGRPSGLAGPGGAGRGEVQPDARVSQQPLVHRGRLVRGQVAADHVDVQAGLDLAAGLIREIAEAGRPVPGRPLAGDPCRQQCSARRTGQRCRAGRSRSCAARALRGSSAAPGRSAAGPGSAVSHRRRRPLRSPAVRGTGRRRHRSCR